LRRSGVGPEPVADLTVRRARAVIEGELVPRAIDELPLVALAACFATGETVIRDAAELRVKESDRIQATARELRRLGADIVELPDGLHIRPCGRLRGAAVSSHGPPAIMLTPRDSLKWGPSFAMLVSLRYHILGFGVILTWCRVAPGSPARAARPLARRDDGCWTLN
jgi:hypothetical protein